MSDWTFAVIADSHLGQPDRAGVHNPASGTWAAARLRALAEPLVGCELILHVGDVIEHGTEDEIREAAAIFAAWPRPPVICLGNHDATEPGQRDRWPELYPAGFGDALHHSFEHRGIRFVILQTWWYDREETTLLDHWPRQGKCLWQVPDEQLDWLATDLAAHPATPTVVVHHPLSLPLTARLTGEADSHIPPPAAAAALDAVLNRHPQVVMLLGGHAHAHQIERAGGRWQIATGCLTEFPYEYRTVTVGAEGWRVATRRVPADEAMLPASEVPRPWVAGQPEDRERLLTIEVPVG